MEEWVGQPTAALFFIIEACRHHHWRCSEDESKMQTTATTASSPGDSTSASGPLRTRQLRRLRHATGIRLRLPAKADSSSTEQHSPPVTKNFRHRRQQQHGHHSRPGGLQGQLHLQVHASLQVPSCTLAGTGTSDDIVTASVLKQPRVYVGIFYVAWWLTHAQHAMAKFFSQCAQRVLSVRG